MVASKVLPREGDQFGKVVDPEDGAARLDERVEESAQVAGAGTCERERERTGGNVRLLPSSTRDYQRKRVANRTYRRRGHWLPVSRTARGSRQRCKVSRSVSLWTYHSELETPPKVRLPNIREPDVTRDSQRMHVRRTDRRPIAARPRSQPLWPFHARTGLARGNLASRGTLRSRRRHSKRGRRDGKHRSRCGSAFTMVLSCFRSAKGGTKASD